MNGQELHFYLAGINNQNFLMRDKETGTWWQQITGKAIYGPMKGASLELVPYDELSFGEWKAEVSGGKVLAPVAKYEKKYDSNWEAEVGKLPVVISFPGTELKSRDVVVGLTIDGVSRAYPWETLIKQSPVLDRVHGTPLLLVVGLDGKSFRVFVSRIDGKDAEFFLKGESQNAAQEQAGQSQSSSTHESLTQASSNQTGSTQAIQPQANQGSKDWVLLDTTSASEWNFQGCAISGTALGECLNRVPALKDYWFDWRNYHPETGIYRH